MFGNEGYRDFKRRLRGETDVDPLEYDVLPERLRTQMWYVIDGLIGPYEIPWPPGDPRGWLQPPPASNETWSRLYDQMVREFGVPGVGGGSRDLRENCFNLILHGEDIDQVLFAVRVALNLVKERTDELDAKIEQMRGMALRSGDLPQYLNSVSLAEGIRELNSRFLENRVGYQYDNGQMLRVDSEISHSEVVRPALQLLSAPHFSAANGEYLRAYEHYRNGRYSEAIVEAEKAFESTMKVICDRRAWPYPPGATAVQLVQVCFAEELIPQMMQSHFGALRSTLESGVPTVRNRLAGHGAGSQPTEVPAYIANYVLHLAAANIVFLVQADLAKPRRR